MEKIIQLETHTNKCQHSPALDNFFGNFVHCAVRVDVFLEIEASVTLPTVHADRIIKKTKDMFGILSIADAKVKWKQIISIHTLSTTTFNIHLF